MSGGYANGATTANGTGRNTRNRTGRKRTSGPGALLKNKLSAPGLKIVDWRAKSGERWSVGAAKVQEKMAHMGASMKLGFYTVTHLVHPIRREAAKESMINKKAAASERRAQKVAAAQGRASAKRARARELRAARLNEAVH